MYMVVQLCVTWKGLHTMRLFTFGNLKLANIQFMTKLRPVGLQMDSINQLEPLGDINQAMCWLLEGDEADLLKAQEYEKVLAARQKREEAK